VVFDNLQPGNYLLTVMRAGYVRTFYGSPLPGRGPGTAVSVIEGKPTPEVRIRVLKGGVIGGTIRSANGRPAPNVQVQATLVRKSGGVWQSASLEANAQPGLGMTTTDDRGVYRIFGLAPGDYIVSVPTIGGLTDEVRPMTTAELQWADSAVAAGAGAGLSSVSPAPAGAPRVAYSAVYFPGTARAEEARILALGPQEERLGTDFALMLVPTATISGRVTDAGGQPQQSVSVTLRAQRPDGLNLFAALFNTSAMTSSDGSFTMSGVKPGEYTLIARATPKTDPQAKPDPAAAAKAMVAGMIGGAPQGATHFAVENLTVNGVDVGNVALQLRPGMTVSGRIVYEATKQTPPADLSKTAITFMPAPTGTGIEAMLAGLLGGGGATTPTIAADGTFTVGGVPPGEYRMNTPFAMVPMMPAGLASPGGWTLKSVMAGGRDIADAPLEIRPGVDVSGVVVTFTDRPAELSGSVTDAAGRPAPGFPIVVFSTDRAYWTLSSRRVQTARPSSDGKYTITGLPAGEYYVCAVTAVDRTEQYDPTFLDQLVPVSFKITIADGEKKTQDLRLGGGG
jgi:hypothetical protein